jgi:hypothetical protein
VPVKASINVPTAAAGSLRRVFSILTGFPTPTRPLQAAPGTSLGRRRKRTMNGGRNAPVAGDSSFNDA